MLIGINLSGNPSLFLGSNTSELLPILLYPGNSSNSGFI